MTDRAMAIERNVSSFLLEMGTAGGGDHRRDDAVEWTVGGSPIGYHNAVVACTAGDDAAAIVEEWRGELERRDLAGSWHLTPTMTPPDLWDHLMRAGFEDGGEEPAMAVALDGVDAPAPVVDIESIATDSGLDDYCSVLAESFGEGPVEAEWVTSIWRRLGTRAPVWRHLVGRLDGEPVATATVHLTGDVAGIYFVATRPAVRGRGIGAAITSAAMIESRQLGASLAVLGSSPMGQRIYERLGFRTEFTYRLAEISAPGAG